MGRLIPLFFFLIITAAPAFAAPALPLDGFADCIHHWQNSHYTTDYPRLSENDVRGIADNILLYQRANGGWRENEDPLRILSFWEKWRIRREHSQADTSFDNRNTWPQVEYLAGAFNLTGKTRYRDGCLRGIDFIFSAQHSSGGFPHSYPSREEYRPYITFADEVTPDVLRTLRKIAAGEKPFVFVDEARRKRAAEAVTRGDTCILKLQVVQNGIPTVWAGQYDDKTLEPAKARAYELPALVSWESVGVVRYLMSIEHPSPKIIQSVECAAAWFKRAQITGLRYETIPAPPIKYTWHTSTIDRRVVSDPSAPSIWARFYDLKTNKPIFANRDGHRVKTLAEVARERRSGYDWYGTWPTELINVEYPAWEKRIGR